MRATFLYMLAVSLAVHGLIAGSVGLSSRWGSAQVIPPRVEKEQTLSLIYPKPRPVKPTFASRAVKSAPAHRLASSASVTPSIPAPPHIAAPTPVLKSPLPALAKAEPIATTPPPAPMSAPRLDGTKGVVFILDVSGSMYEPYAGSTRLAYAREDLSERVRALADGTPFAVVLYAEKAYSNGPLVAATAATRAAAVRFLSGNVDDRGDTNLPAGLVAARALNTGALVLATDGDLNISGTDLMLQAREILGERGNGPSLLILGIAPRPGTTADHLLEDLAELEGGSYMVEQSEDVTALR